jgi:DNA repair exonuclease SbcCD ATPase subunit
MTLKDLKQKYDKIDRHLEYLEKQKKNDVDRLDLLNTQLEKLKLDKTYTQKAEVMMISKATEIRDSAIDTIESIVTLGVKFIYGDDYRVQFNKHEEQREQGQKSGFNISFEIVSNSNGEELVTGIDDRGGGLLEVASALTRLAFLKMKKHDAFIILDESWSAVSADSKMENLIEFIKYHVEENDLQLILNTHRQEIFGKIANKIIRVTKKDGIANMTPVTYDVIQEEQKSLIDG